MQVPGKMENVDKFINVTYLGFVISIIYEKEVRESKDRIVVVWDRYYHKSQYFLQKIQTTKCNELSADTLGVTLLLHK